MALRGLAERLRAAWRGHTGRQDAVLAELGRLREDAAAVREHAARGAEELRALAAEVARCRGDLAARPAPPPDRSGLLRDAAVALLAAADPRRGDPLALRRHESQFYSQNGEDGAVAEIFRRIGAKDRFFVEIGVEDGTQNNTRLLLEQGWRGVWVEGDPTAAAAARRGFAAFVEAGALAVVAAAAAAAETVDRLLDDAGAPAAFDFLSLDIDRNTAQVWRALRRTARVACVEYNGCLPPSAALKVPYDPAAAWDGTNWFGAGLKTMERIGAAKGMSLVACDGMGVNAFFVAGAEAQGRFREPFTAENHHEPLRLHLVGRSGHPPSPAGRRWVVDGG